MRKIFGSTVVANCKVKNKKVSYSDPAVCRIFFKIHETLKTKVRDYNGYLGVYENKKEGISVDVRTEFFLDAIDQDKSKIERFNSKLYRDIYHAMEKGNNCKGMPIADILRGRIECRNERDFLAAYESIKNTTKGDSGNLIQILRVNNRMTSKSSKVCPMYDVVVNFRYGKYVVAEIQIVYLS